jgi:hypothetical protein
VSDRTVKLSRVQSAFDGVDYPVSRTDAAEAAADVTVQFADGEANLGDLIAECHDESFDGPDELVAGLYATLPVAALGEPGQSDGDA